MAYVGYVLLFLALTYGLFRLQLWRKTQEAEQHYWQELDQAKSTLFTNISHEFRTPLTLILGEASSLQEKVNGQIQAQIQRIKRSGQRLLWLVNQLLELAQADSGFLQLELQQADIIAFLRRNLQAFHSLAELREMELIFNTAVSELVMDFDPQRLQRVFSNLIDNAIKFSDDQAKITLSVAIQQAEGQASMLCCRVKDEGSGIAAADLSKVFDRFYRINDKQQGTGIGLALTKELVLLMDGAIKVSSEPGEGSVFEVLLPINQQAPLGDGNWDSLEEIAPVAEASTAIEGKTHQLNVSQLLVIEDNEDLRAFLQVCLSADYQLTMARDGREGLDLALDQTYDLIISDVMMPRLDGFTVCQTLKEELITSHIPVILLTARVDQASRLEGLARGADAYLAKPFDPNELRLLCRQLLRQRRRLSRYYLEMIRTGQLSEDLIPAEQQAEMAFIVEARQQLITHLAEEDFGVEALAQALNISRSHLHRKLQQMAGMSTSRFIRSIRVNEAQKLLQDPSLSISEVAYAVGFSDPDYFSKVFKDEGGVSPSVFRKQSFNGKM
jgi:DNA-binding response OmpR family regulator/nitrogen-specific signal transduction histidine kinase